MPPLSEASTAETYGGGASGARRRARRGHPEPDRGRAGASAAGGYHKTSNTQNNAVGNITKTSDAAPGSVRSSAWRCCWTRTPRRSTRPQVQQLVSSAVGLDPKRGDTHRA